MSYVAQWWCYRCTSGCGSLCKIHIPLCAKTKCTGAQANVLLSRKVVVDIVCVPNHFTTLNMDHLPLFHTRELFQLHVLRYIFANLSSCSACIIFLPKLTFVFLFAPFISPLHLYMYRVGDNLHYCIYWTCVQSCHAAVLRSVLSLLL